MNKKLARMLENTISLEEFSKHFTPEQNRAVEDGIRRYDLVVSLRNARKKKKLTQQELAKRAKLPRSTVSKVESGNYNPTLSTLVSMAAAMNKTLELKLV